jgi:ribosomal-protein-alanine N-acetyltransferase
MSAAAVRLEPLTTPLLVALQERRSSYAAAFPYPLSPDWPNADFLEALGSFIDSRAARPAEEQWVFLILDAAEQVVGELGAKGPPSAAGEIEVGYGIALSQRGRSFATSALEAFKELAFAREGVRCLTAECLAANPASIRVLEKCGFQRAGAGKSPEGALIKWRLERELNAPAPLDGGLKPADALGGRGAARAASPRRG